MGALTLAFYLVFSPPAAAESALSDLPLALFRLDSCSSQVRNRRIREAEKALDTWITQADRLEEGFDGFHALCVSAKAAPESSDRAKVAKEEERIDEGVRRLKRREFAIREHLAFLAEELREQDLIPPRNCIQQLKDFHVYLPPRLKRITTRHDRLCTGRYLPGKPEGYYPLSRPEELPR